MGELSGLITPPVALTVVNPLPAKLEAAPLVGAAPPVVPAVPPAPIVTVTVTVIDAPGVRPVNRFRAYPPPATTWRSPGSLRLRRTKLTPRRPGMHHRQ